MRHFTHLKLNGSTVIEIDHELIPTPKGAKGWIEITTIDDTFEVYSDFKLDDLANDFGIKLIPLNWLNYGTADMSNLNADIFEAILQQNPGLDDHLIDSLNKGIISSSDFTLFEKDNKYSLRHKYSTWEIHDINI